MTTTFERAVGRTSEHTPGPWRVAGTVTKGRHYIIGANPAYGVAITEVDASCGADSRANAHLIAASPTMFDALAAVVAWDDASTAQGYEGNTDYAGLDAAISCARAAIAKARGEG